MKIAIFIARVLLGLIFFLFGLNAFVRFLPIPAYHGTAEAFLHLLIVTRYIFIVKAIEVTGGAMLLARRFVPLALTLLGPVVINIFIFHLLMDRSLLLVAIVVLILWAFLLWAHRKVFLPLLVTHAHAA